MKRAITGLLLFLVAFAFFLVATTPARFALQYLPANLPLRLLGVDGTVWNGQATQAIWQNQPIGRIEWRLHPLPLLLGKISAEVTIDGNGITARGKVAVSSDQTIVLTDTTVDATLERLPLPRDLMATPGGRGHADIHFARIEKHWPTKLNANVTWSPATLVAPFELELGKATLKLTGKGDTLSGSLRGSGALNSKGKLTLSRNGAFSANIRIAPTDETPRELRDILPMIGRPDSRGAITIRQSMQLRGFPP